MILLNFRIPEIEKILKASREGRDGGKMTKTGNIQCITQHQQT